MKHMDLPDGIGRKQPLPRCLGTSSTQRALGFAEEASKVYNSVLYTVFGLTQAQDRQHPAHSDSICVQLIDTDHGSTVLHNVRGSRLSLYTRICSGGKQNRGGKGKHGQLGRRSCLGDSIFREIYVLRYRKIDLKNHESFGNIVKISKIAKNREKSRKSQTLRNFPKTVKISKNCENLKTCKNLKKSRKSQKLRIFQKS